MFSLDLVAVPFRVPFREQLQARLNAKLGPADPFRITDRSVVFASLDEFCVARCVVGDVQAFGRYGVETVFARAGDGTGKLLVGVLPIPHCGRVRHVFVAANDCERLTP